MLSRIWVQCKLAAAAQHLSAHVSFMCPTANVWKSTANSCNITLQHSLEFFLRLSWINHDALDSDVHCSVMAAKPTKTPALCTQHQSLMNTQGPHWLLHFVLSRDVLCTDKTGTLTSEQTTLELKDNQDYTSRDVLKLAYANSYFQVCTSII